MPRDDLDLDLNGYLALVDAAAEFQPHAAAAGRPAPTYSQINTLVVNGVLPAVRIGRNRYFERAKLPEILEKLGLVPGAGAKSSKSRKATAAPVRDTVAA